MSILLQMLVAILSGLAKAWIGQEQANNNAIKVGELKQANSTESQANELTVKAFDARSNFVPFTAYSLSNLKPNADANFRD